MSPDLQGFELDAETGANEPTAAVLDVLGLSFGVAADYHAPGSGTHKSTWLDTFDWRLNRAGLVLEYEHTRRGGRLLLSRDSTPQAEQPVERWPSRKATLVEDLPEGPVRDQIAKLARPRALLPMASATGTVTVRRLLNADGKTVALLTVGHESVTCGDRTVELPVRLAITEVRGYPAQARKAARLLAAAPGVTPAGRTVFAAALAALGRHCDDYSNAVAADITAQLPASVAAATLLLGLLDTLEHNVDGTLRDIDTEFLHDLRVAVRRTRSGIKLFADVLPDTRPYAAEFKWLGDLTTPTRDLDVHLLGFGAMGAQLLAASPADLEPFRAFLIRRRAKEFRLLVAGLRSARFRALADHWRKALLEVRDANAASARGRRKGSTAAELAVAKTARTFRRVAAQGGAITAASPPESLHDLRKRCKELRYALEFFAPLYDPAGYRKVVGGLKQLQDTLGEFQDSEVQREEIGDLAAAMLAERAAPAATLLAMGEIAANLARSQAEARADFADRFTRFAGPQGQERFRALLAGAGLAGAGPDK
jgi:CHAD domain-containing protein